MSGPISTARMSFWQRLDWLPNLYLSLLLLLCALAAWRPLSAASDFWALAAGGRWMCENGDVPRETLFLWSASETWVAHSWLTQLVFYGLTTTGPEQTFSWVVIAFTAVFVALPYLLIWRLWARHGRISSWVILPFALAIIANFHRYQTRPELFTALFLCCLLAFLIGWSGPPGTGPIAFTQRRPWLATALLFTLFVAWANFHGVVLVGLVLLAATAVCELVQSSADKRSCLLALLALLAPFAVCVNPYGFAYWGAFEPLTSFRWARISDAPPLWKIDPLPLEEIAIQGLLLVLAVTAWALNAQRRWSHLCWLLILGALYANAHRNAWLLTLGSLTVLAANSSALKPERLWQKFSRRRLLKEAAKDAEFPVPTGVRWVVRLGLVSWLGTQICLRAFVLQQCHEPYRPVHLESGVVEFLKSHPINGRIFNDFESSRYLEWHLAGQPPLFIDIHLAYPDSVARDYLDILQVTPRGRLLLEERNIDCVVLTINRPGPTLAPLAGFLDRGATWKRVYAESDGVIWVRWSAQYEQLWGNGRPAARSVSFQLLERYHKGDTPDAHNAFSPF